ncbi:hypothetical protein ACLB2K_059307 [Fragaria x ananassa]
MSIRVQKTSPCLFDLYLLIYFLVVKASRVPELEAEVESLRLSLEKLRERESEIAELERLVPMHCDCAVAKYKESQEFKDLMQAARDGGFQPWTLGLDLALGLGLLLWARGCILSVDWSPVLSNKSDDYDNYRLLIKMAILGLATLRWLEVLRGFDTFASQSLSRSQFNLKGRMGEIRDNDGYEEELVDYDEEEQNAPNSVSGKPNGESAKKGYVGIHSSGFRDFLLKPELLRAIVDSGFEHPSEVQHECIPQAILGMDVLCQAKSGMGKTAVFVLSTLQQIEPVAGQVAALILCHTRELAYQICHEFERFSTYLPELKVAVFYGGVSIKVHRDLLKNECHHIVVGTPGRVLALARDKELGLKNVRHFILDECDKMLESLDMRRDVQMIFKLTPHDKQVMMFSATLSKEIRPVCKKFMQDPMEIYVDDEAKLTLHGLVQHYIKLSESEKNRKLTDLLDALDFNQVVIFVKSVSRAAELNKLLADCNFPSICIHS